ATRIFKNELGLSEREDDGSMFCQRRGGRLEVHPAGHAKVAQQGNLRAFPGTPEGEEQVFATPGQTHEPRSEQRALELLFRNRTQHAEATNFDSSYRFAFQQRREI